MHSFSFSKSQVSVAAPEPAIHTLASLTKLWSLAFAVLLMGTSYLLWLPPTWSSFPQIPAVDWLVGAPPWYDYLGVAFLVVAILAAFGFELRSVVGGSRAEHTAWARWTWLAIIVCGAWLVCLSQHRLQAWFLQLLLFCCAFLFSDVRAQIVWLQRIVLSIYVYSALGKLDFEFVHTVGQDFLQAAASLVGMNLENWNATDRIAAALALPLSELVLAGGLIWSKSRPVAGVATCLFHLGLALLVFGPLKHSWGVFLWNLQFAGQAVFLFVLSRRLAKKSSSVIPATTGVDALNALAGSDSTRSSSRSSESPSSESIRSQSPSESRSSESPSTTNVTGPKSTGRDWVLRAVLGIFIFMPLVERWGWWDHWPSWALYAPHSSRVRVTIATYASDQLPDSLQRLLPEVTDQSQVGIELPLARWSLTELGVPIYPQARFQLGVARAISSKLRSPIAIQAEIRESADRISGQRQSRMLRGAQEIRQASRFFTLGSSPRED